MKDTTSLCLAAPAKLNLFLHVTGQRPDGYHTLQTLFQFLDFQDELSFKITNHNEISRLDEHDIPLPKEDLSVQAARLLKRHCNVQQGAEITLRKQIPAGAGLGGGSSNAATTLIGLNHLWNTGLTRSELLSLALQLGADVPVFIFAHAAWAEGIGEQLTAVNPPEQWVCLAVPKIHVSTADVFRQPTLKRNHPPVDWTTYLSGQCGNDLEFIVRDQYPAVETLFQALSEYGQPRLNGSGGSVFLPCESRQQAQSTAEKLTGQFIVRVCRSVNKHPASELLVD